MEAPGPGPHLARSFRPWPATCIISDEFRYLHHHALGANYTLLYSYLRMLGQLTPRVPLTLPLPLGQELVHLKGSLG